MITQGYLWSNAVLRINRKRVSKQQWAVISGMAILLGMLLLFLWHAWTMVARDQRLAEDLYLRPFAVASASAEIKSEVYQIRLRILEGAVLKSQFDLGQVQLEIADLLVEVERKLDLIQSLSPSRSSDIVELRDSLKVWGQIRKQVFESLAVGRVEQARSIIMNDGTPQYNRVISAAERIRQVSTTQAGDLASQASVEFNSNRQRLISMVVLLVAFAVLMFSALFKIYRRHERLNANVLDSMGLGVAYFDRSMRVDFVNEQICERWGQSKAWLGKSLSAILPHHLFEEVRRVENQLNLGEPVHFERAVEVQDGESSERFLNISIIPDMLNDQVQGFYWIEQDVTRLKQAYQQLENALLENRALLNTINYQLLYSVTDLQGRIIDVNDNFCQISGYSKEELVGNTHRVVNSKVHGAEFWDSMWKTIASGKAWHGEICNRSKSGRLYWVDSVIAPFIGPSGKIERYVSIRTVITDRMELELKMQAITNSAQDAIVMIDEHGRLSFWNKAAERLLGYSADEAIGKLMHQLIAPARYELQIARGMAAFSTSGTGASIGQVSEFAAVHKDGREIPFSIAVSSVEIQGRWHAVGIMRDISEIKRIHAELSQSKEIAEQANQAKSQFLANMSHEIRTPLNALIGVSYLLSQSNLTEEQNSHVNVLQTSSRSLMDLISDVLDLSKIEAGEMLLEQTEFDVQTLFEELRVMFEPIVSGKNIGLRFASVPRLPGQLHGDPVRLRQMLINLVNNAIKFTVSGGVSVECRCEPCEDGSVMVEFVVQDTGIGISEAEQLRLFKPFSQADSSTTRKFGGTGLGLSIVQKLTRQMGGEVSLRSVPGIGSAFAFRVPLTCVVKQAASVAHESGFDNDQVPAETTSVAAEQGDPTDTYSLEGISVLVVDDSQINLMVCKSILQLQGVQVTTCESGRQALDVMRSSPSAFNAVLMDLQMPEMDGFETTRILRADVRFQSIPIIALTAGALSSERTHAFSAGMNDFLTKPLEPTHLFKALADAVTG